MEILLAHIFSTPFRPLRAWASTISFLSTWANYHSNSVEQQGTGKALTHNKASNYISSTFFFLFFIKNICILLWIKTTDFFLSVNANRLTSLMTFHAVTFIYVYIYNIITTFSISVLLKPGHLFNFFFQYFKHLLKPGEHTKSCPTEKGIAGEGHKCLSHCQKNVKGEAGIVRRAVDVHSFCWQYQHIFGLISLSSNLAEQAEISELNSAI